MSRRSAYRAGAQTEAGFTTIELLLASVLAIVVLGAIYTLSVAVGSQSVASSGLTQTEDTARIEMDTMVRTIRDAPRAGGTSTPLVVARAHDLIVASNTAATSWTRICLGSDPGTAAGTNALRIGTMSGAFADPGSSCPSGVAGTWTYRTLFSTGVLSGDSLFSFDACPNITTTTCNVSLVHSIGIVLDVQTNTGVRHLRLNSAVSMRNAA
ncbi:MAG: hypothetical protein JWM31_2562 [Solirubrobacterales bacterium]|nr:hypothetical protein [Solirubrobacterales bacterium]